MPSSRYRLVEGADRITTYTFNTGTAKHIFCAVCGVKSFYIPRSNPDGFSVNLRCLDDPKDFDEVRIVNFDGRSDWDASALAIAHKSQAYALPSGAVSRIAPASWTSCFA